jgi:hypothetical protein
MSGGLREASSAWPRTGAQPCTQLLLALLADVYGVRDLVARSVARGRKLPPGLGQQYAQDRQWIAEPEERRPFSFGWVCQHLGLEVAAVRASYLSGRSLTLGQHGPE